MTVSQLRKLLKGLPSKMSVVMPLDDDTIVSVCAQNSKVAKLEIDDEEEIHEPVEVLLLVGCNCSEEIPIGELNSQPELN